jgi:hypothetical protein
VANARTSRAGGIAKANFFSLSETCNLNTAWTFAKKIAEAVYDSTHKLILEAQEETEEAQKALKDKISVTDTLTEANLLIDHIEDIVEITLSSKDKTIKDLIETYREDYED